MAEYIYNALISYVNQAVGVSSAATSIQLLDTGLFPTVCNYRITVDSEIMLVTANTGGLLTVSRAQEGTVATAHAINTPVFLSITAGGLNAWSSGGGGGGLVGVGGSAYFLPGTTLPAGVITVLNSAAGVNAYGGLTVVSVHSSGGDFKPGTAGTYVVVGQASSTSNYNALDQVLIGVNGSWVANNKCFNNGSGSSGTVSYVASIGASDTIQLAYVSISGSVSDGTGFNRLTVFRVD